MVNFDKNKKLVELEDISSEKKHWVRLTRACNNSCMFCLDVEAMNSSSLSLSDIEEDLNKGIEKGAVRAILSGGEPTIHKKYLEVIELAKKLGYKKVQTITNGRMFCYKEMLDKAVKAGLSEVTFSIHGHNPELHDKLTGIPNSFDQVMVALDNAKSVNGLVVNIDICVNKINLPYIGEILDFFIDLGVTEFDMLSVIPFGRAWEKKDELFFNIHEAWPHVKKILKRANNENLHIWLNRFTPEHLEEYEHMIQTPVKLHSDMEGMKDSFLEYLKGGKMPCAGERCEHCFMNKLCSYLFLCRHLPKTSTETKPDIYINKKTANDILSDLKDKKIDLEATIFGVNNQLDLKEAIDIELDLKEFFSKVEKLGLEQELQVYNVPYCLYPKGRHVDASAYKLINPRKYNTSNIQDLVDDFIVNSYYIKSLRCNICSRYYECRGAHINYIRQYGFNSLNPIS